MAGCTCSDEAVARTLTSRSDFLRLARCCRRFAPFRSGRISVALPAVDATERSVLEERINRLWQACGCGEAAVAMCVLIVLWFAGLHPFDAWRQQASGLAAGLACIGFVAVGVTLVKIAAITVSHRRLARLLERESVALDT